MTILFIAAFAVFAALLGLGFWMANVRTPTRTEASRAFDGMMAARRRARIAEVERRTSHTR